MAGFLVKEELVPGGDYIPESFQDMTLHITDYGSISNTNMTEVYLTEDNPASGIQEVDTQEDPLADTTADWQICDQVNVKNQLVNLDNSAQHQISEAFSIVNLEKIKMEEQQEGSILKRKAADDKLEESIVTPSKGIKFEAELKSNPIDMKEPIIDVGSRINLKSHQEQSCDSACDLQSHNPEHVILKIYTCSKCNHKCTDAIIHDDHATVCFSKQSDTLNTATLSSTSKHEYYNCEICSFKFRSKQNLISHANKHSSEKLFICYVCNAEMATVDGLKRHFMKAHTKRRRKYKCNVCPYSNTYCRKLKEHIVTHNTDRMLNCHLCKQNYEDLDELNEHLEHKHKETGPPNLANNENSDKFIFDSSAVVEKPESNDISFKKLKSIFISKTVIKNDFYHCNGCVYKFLKPEHLLNHKQQHLNVEKAYKCSKCLFESLCALVIENHANGHSANVQCNVCDTQLKPSQIRQHAVFHVNDGLYCFSCSDNSETTQAFEHHLLFKHGYPQKNLHSCGQCSFKHLDTAKLRQHIKFHHFNKEELCNVRQLSSPVKNTSLVTTSDSNSVEDVRHQSVTDESDDTRQFIAVAECVESDNSNKGINQFLSIFKCSKCSFQCSSIHDLQAHDNNTHGNNMHFFVCSGCGWKSSVLRFYLQHILVHDVRVRMYSCSFCQFQSNNETPFLNHLEKHKLKSCPFCEFKVYHFSNFKRHLDSHHNNKNMTYSCKLCPFSSETRSKLGLHCVTFHAKKFSTLKLPIPSELLNSEADGCGLCPFKNPHTSTLKRHISQHYVNGTLSKDINHKPQCKIDSNVKIKCFKKKLCHRSALQETNKNSSFIYRCSQCLHTHNDRRVIADHLFKVHNIRGGVKNHLIVKIGKAVSPNNSTKRESHKVLANPKDIKTNMIQVKQRHLKAAGPNKIRNKMKEVLNKCGDINEIIGSDNKVDYKLSIETKLLKGKIASGLNCVKKHTCKYCFFSTCWTHTFRKHMARHFSSGRHHNVNIKVENDYSSQDLNTVNKSNNNNIVYCCSQCDDKTWKQRKSVNIHLLKVHNINGGGLKNKMILKTVLPKTQLDKLISGCQEKEIISENSCNTKENKLNSENTDKTMQNVNLENTTDRNSRVYCCTVCHRTYKNSRTLKHHLLRTHNTTKDNAKNNSIVNKILRKTKVKVVSTKAKVKTKELTFLQKQLNLQQTVKERIVPDSNEYQVKSILPNRKGDEVGCVKCVKCSIHLLSKSAQITHKRIGHKEFWLRPFSCTMPKCGTRFKDKRSQLQHERGHCSVAKTKEKSVNHILERDRPDVSDEESLTCGECDYVTFDVSDLVQHMLVHSGIIDD